MQGASAKQHLAPAFNMPLTRVVQLNARHAMGPGEESQSPRIVFEVPLEWRGSSRLGER